MSWHPYRQLQKLVWYSDTGFNLIFVDHNLLVGLAPVRSAGATHKQIVIYSYAAGNQWKDKVGIAQTVRAGGTGQDVVTGGQVSTKHPSRPTHPSF